MRKSTLRLLRFPFSFFLMPVYWFALSQVVFLSWPRAVLVFIILHGLVYPSSNGYNSYMDRDQTSIGGLKNPPQPTPQLFTTTVVMDLAAVILSALVSWYFLAGVIVYILASRAYSYRGIRVKKYPIASYLLVVCSQGALTFFLVYNGSHIGNTSQVPVPAMIASSLLVGGFYPLTQLYQHEADLKDGVKTISWLLGYKGTFIFSIILYCLAFVFLAYDFFSSLEIKQFYILATCLLPILVYFLVWAAKVWKDTSAANFENTMRMNILASCCTNLGFILVLFSQ
jgi:1,4-dihydroxy-2-naphthoate polyprenyltransferase